MTVLFQTDFTQPGGTALTAINPKWILAVDGPISALVVNSSAPRLRNTSSSARAAVFNEANDGKIAQEADIYIGVDAGRFGLIFRNATPSVKSYYLLEYNSGVVKWRKYTSGTPVDIGGTFTVPDTIGLVYKIRGEVEVDELRMYVNNVLRVTVIDSTYATGYAGILFGTSKIELDALKQETIETVVTPVEFTEVIDDQDAVAGRPFVLDIRSRFIGSLTPITISLLTGSLSGTGLSLASGVLSGSPAVGMIPNLSFLGVDTGANEDSTNTFSINVVAPPPGPTITLHPVSQSVTAGANVTFTANATASSGGGTMTKQWELSTNNGTSWANTGTANQNLTITGATTGQNGHQVRCKFSDGNGTVYTEPATLTVTSSTLYGFDFNAASDTSQVFGDLAGALTALARQTAVAIVVRAYDISTGALVATSAALTTDGNGRLPRWTHTSLASATAYHLLFVRQSDGAVCSDRMTTT